MLDVFCDLFAAHPYYTVSIALLVILAAVAGTVEQHRRRQIEIETLKGLRNQNAAPVVCPQCRRAALSRQSSFCTRCGTPL